MCVFVYVFELNLMTINAITCGNITLLGDKKNYRGPGQFRTLEEGSGMVW